MHKNSTYFSLIVQMHAARKKVPQHNFFIFFRFITSLLVKTIYLVQEQL